LRAFAKRAEASSTHGVPMSRGNVPENLIEEFMAGLREAGLEEPGIDRTSAPRANDPLSAPVLLVGAAVEPRARLG
jgi:hypothetical protein